MVLDNTGGLLLGSRASLPAEASRQALDLVYFGASLTGETSAVLVKGVFGLRDQLSNGPTMIKYNFLGALGW